MKRTQILLTEEQYRLIKAISNEKNISMAEVIRECILNYTGEKSPITDDDKYERVLKLSGRFSSAKKDLSLNHDKYLTEDFKK